MIAFRHRLSFPIFVWILLSTWNVETNAEEYFQVRNGISNSLILFEKGDYQQVAFFGGEALKGKKPYSQDVVALFKEQFKDANIAHNPFPDQGGSWYGAFRVARAEPVFGATVHNACMELIDFAPDDIGKTEREIVDAWEGMVRGLLSFRSSMDIVFVYTLSPAMLDDFKSGRTPEVIRWAETVAEHYNLPSVNLARIAAEKILSGEISQDEFFAGNSTPTEKGDKIYADAMRTFLDACMKARPAETNLVHRKMPEALSPTNMGRAQIIAYDWAELPKDAKVGRPSSLPYFRHVLVFDDWDAVVSLKFTGSAVGLLDLAPSNAPRYEYSIDGSEWKALGAISSGWSTDYSGGKHVVRVMKIAGELDPTREHELKLRMAELQLNVSDLVLQIGAFLVDGSVKDPLAGLSPLEQADTVYADMDPIRYDPPKDRWKFLPKTMKKLREGETLKIVMLGDSIMGDTGSSNYEKILEREYPNCKVERIMSLRGSTGCWWYKDENRVQDYVLRHEPDLLMIGGISQREDIDAIRSVIHQVREKQSPDIMLITPVFGAEPDPHLRNWTFEIDAEKYAYRANLKKLAEEEDCEFVDLTGVVWQYMLDSGKCYGWFKRDYVHANRRGFQVIGRHLVRYLTED